MKGQALQLKLLKYSLVWYIFVFLIAVALIDFPVWELIYLSKIKTLYDDPLNVSKGGVLLYYETRSVFDRKGYMNLLIMAWAYRDLGDMRAAYKVYSRGLKRYPSLGPSDFAGFLNYMADEKNRPLPMVKRAQAHECQLLFEGADLYEEY